MLTKETLMARTVRQGECRVWTGPINKRTGYGSVWADGRTRQVHVVAYERQHGPVPPGLCVLHTCDNRPCIEGLHLFTGTKQDNTDDMVSKCRDRKAKGTEHGNAKLTPEIAAEMRRRFVPHSRTHGSAALAREFGVHQATAYALLHGKTWKQNDAEVGEVLKPLCNE